MPVSRKSHCLVAFDPHRQRCFLSRVQTTTSAGYRRMNIVHLLRYVQSIFFDVNNIPDGRPPFAFPHHLYG